MKTALLFSGQPRSVQETYSTIYENIISKNNPDVYVHVWNQPELIGKQPISAGGVPSSDPIPENIYQIIVDLYNPVGMAIDKFIMFDELNYAERKYPQIKPKYSLSQRYSIRESFKFIELLDYDVVIRMRFDWAIQIAIDVSTLDLSGIIVPNDCPHPGGINDQFAIGTKSHMEVYCNLYDNIHRLYNEQGVPFCDELLLYAHLNEHKIPFTPTTIPYHLQRATHNSHLRAMSDIL